jgi:hypothetical protein
MDATTAMHSAAARASVGSGCGQYPGWCLVEIGWTLRGLDAMGDICSMKLIPSDTTSAANVHIDGDDAVGLSKADSVANTVVWYPSGQEFLRIEWDGFYRSEADELYHAVWDTIEGSTVLRCPVAGHVALLCCAMPLQILDETSVVAHVYCTNESLQQAIPSWMDASSYLEYTLEHVERGKFAESHR